MSPADWKTIARMEREFRHDGWQKRVGPAAMAGACLGGFAAFILFALWLLLAGLGVL